MGYASTSGDHRSYISGGGQNGTVGIWQCDSEYNGQWVVGFTGIFIVLHVLVAFDCSQMDFYGRPERDEILTPIDTLISLWLAPSFCGLRDFATIMFFDICVW